MTALCHDNHAGENDAFLKKFNSEVARSRVPLSGGMDLTYRCNLNCAHCYAKPAGAGGELNTGEVVSIIDQVSEAGCLFFLMTGGEPLLREDFGTIYSHARMRGLIVTVFTNATLVDEQTAALFGELPPRSVEVSIYGATPSTHDGITGVEGSHERCLRGVRLLRERGVKLVLKTVLMNRNADEFHAMERLAVEMGARFRMDAMLFPRLDGGMAPMELCVSPDVAVEKEFGSETRRQEWRRYAERMGRPAWSGRPARRDTCPPGYGGRRAGAGKLYDCGAGLNCFHVDARGILHPCLMARSIGYDLRRGTFEEGWRKEIPKVREIPAPADYACGGCGKRGACSFCPASLEMEGGVEHVRYVCDVAGRRLESLALSIYQPLRHQDTKVSLAEVAK